MRWSELQNVTFAGRVESAVCGTPSRNVSRPDAAWLPVVARGGRVPASWTRSTSWPGLLPRPGGGIRSRTSIQDFRSALRAMTLGRGRGALYGLRANSAPWPLSPRPRRTEWSLGTIPAEKSPESRPDPSSRTIPARPTALRATNSCGVCAPDGPEFRAAPMPSIPKCLVTPAASHGGTGTRCREARGVAVQAHASVRTRPD